MNYINVADAITMPGLKLVLTAGSPGPWSEAAKAIFQIKGIKFIAVRQDAGGENADLLQWTGQTTAPVAVYNNEAPRCQSLDILFLAEQLNPSPALIPHNAAQRATMFGLIREIIGEQGFGWQRRLLMLQPLAQLPAMAEVFDRLANKYGYSEAAAKQAESVCIDILALLAQQLLQQQRAGQPYFMGESLTALDIYWANFATMLQPLTAPDNPMPEALRHSYSSLPEKLKASYDPILLQHRDYMYQHHLTLPLDF